MGTLDAVSHEFAREHYERLPKQLVLVPEDSELTRIAEFGSSPHKIVALGLNLLLHLLWAAWLTAGCLRGRRPFAALERWHARYLPVYGGWAVVVVAVFPPVLGFA